MTHQEKLLECHSKAAQQLDNWLQQPDENQFVAMPRRCGASTLLQQAVEGHHGFFLTEVRPGLESVWCEKTGKSCCLGTPTPTDETDYFTDFRIVRLGLLA